MNWSRSYLILAGIMVLIIALFIPVLPDFIYPANSQYSDLAITHYPNSLFIQNSIQDYGQIPLWNDTLMAGYPFYADPLAGFWYPPSWLSLILPLPLGINLLVLLHLMAGACGMFLLIRTVGKSPMAALCAAAAFAVFPKIYAHFGSGHITYLYAFCITPWMLYSLSKWKGGSSWLKSALVSGIILALMITADMRWLPYAGMIAAAFLVSIWPQICSGGLARGALSILVMGVSGLALSAVFLLPFVNFLLHSTRVSMSLSDRLVYSLQPSRLLNFIMPDLGGGAETAVYLGSGVLVLGIISWIVGNTRTKIVYLLLLCLSIMLSLGKFLPFNLFVYQLPGLDLIRVPSRSIFVFGFSFILLCGYSLDGYLHGDYGRVSRYVGRLLLAGAIAGSILFCIGTLIPVPENALESIWGPVVIGSISLLLLARSYQWISVQKTFVLLMVLILADGTGVSVQYYRGESRKAVLGRNEWSAIGRIQGRVYSPSYSLPQEIAASNRIDLVSAVNPMQLKSFVDYMDRASGVPRQGYDVVIPPLLHGNPDTDNQAYNPNAALLRPLGVNTILSSFPLSGNGLMERPPLSQTFNYQVENPLPEIYLVRDNGEIDLSAIEFSDATNNWIRTKVEGPGILVYSGISYPGWRAKVDGETMPMLEYQGIFRAIRVAAGKHEVFTQFLPWDFIIGGGITLSTIILMLILLKKRQDSDATS